ncbi:GntR family transcriptional regulator [Streptomyces sp. NPDC001493]
MSRPSVEFAAKTSPNPPGTGSREPHARSQEIIDKLIALLADRTAFPPGSRLPSRRVLRLRFQVSTNALEAAMADLKAKGRISVTHNGTFVPGAAGTAPSKGRHPIVETHQARLKKVRHRITETVRARIADGSIRPRKPLTRNLAVEFTVSDATVRTALRPLIAEGRLGVHSLLGICVPGPPPPPAARRKRQLGNVPLPGTPSRTVYDGLLSLLSQENQYGPGRRLPSYQELALQHGVSLYAVRGGVKPLEAQGRIHVSSRGAIVLGEGYSLEPPIARVVRDRIAAGRIKPMRNIVHDLVAEFRTRDWKVRAALKPLVEEGLLVSSRGLGTVVPRPRKGPCEACNVRAGLDR